MHAKLSRRRFLKTTGALIASSTAVAPTFGAASDKPVLEIGVHPYSLRPLFASGDVTLDSYARFARQSLALEIIEFDADACAPLYEKPERADAYRRGAHDEGVRIGTLLAGATPALDAPTARERQSAVEAHLRWTDVAHRLGCAFLRIRAGTSGRSKSDAKAAAIDGIGDLASRMTGSGVRPLLENIQGHSRDPAWLTGIVDSVGPERLGALGDFGNFDGDIYKGMEVLTPYCDALCSKSWDFDAVGEETEIEFEKILGVVRSHRFSGWIAIEYLGSNTPPAEGVRKTSALIRKWANV